ncbi:MAG: hypothetical protein Q8P59_10015 [Dehalococcoidia bacterium]|nr:hypothetical protein [Dehalococcoidia bacterium]
MDYKLMVQAKDNRAMVAIQRPGCDPFLKLVTLTGEDDQARLRDLGEGLCALAREAEEQWATAPKYPAYTPPKVEAPAQPAAAKTEAKPKGAKLPREKAPVAPAEPALTQQGLPFF